MVRWFFGFVLLLTSFSSFAQDNRFSQGLMNGYMWRQMSEEDKAYYVAGVVEASSLLGENPNRPVNLEKCRCKAGDLMDGATKFYKTMEQRWMRLPIVVVLSGENSRRAGVPLENISVFYAGMLAEIEELDKAQKHPR
jgi:hypothetical protein